MRVDVFAKVVGSFQDIDQVLESIWPDVDYECVARSVELSPQNVSRKSVNFKRIGNRFGLGLGLLDRFFTKDVLNPELQKGWRPTSGNRIQTRQK